ncbi:TIR domain-containing protein [Ligilactobacillus aviarius]|uniref:TIR domain-containing protein n=1 Tax=Ligilactobacillus aviarius TaxID=1606 RepID=UPI00255B98C8|nr:TIR domain-containing protein [Ligilactobacillus aviarius]
MGHKIFVSYKYADEDVQPLTGYKSSVRGYVDYLQDIKFSGDDLNKAEKDDEDLSEFKENTIKGKLKDKIWDSSVTIILISPNMVDLSKPEEDQWIPWEVSYSLKNIRRTDFSSRTNGILAVVLPDRCGSYDYFIKDLVLNDGGKDVAVREIQTSNTFKIISNNMFNQTNPNIRNIQGHKVYYGESSYIKIIKWSDFIDKTDDYIEKAISIRDNCSEYRLNTKVK